MPSNIFATTGTNVSIIFVDKTNSDGKVVMMDASKLGHKEKVDGKNQKIVLSNEEIERIIKTFNSKKAEQDFCAVVDYGDIENNKYSFVAGQYFKVEITYEEIDEDTFNKTIHQYQQDIISLFSESHVIEEEIKRRLGELRYGD